jgi:hypothetical protein
MARLLFRLKKGTSPPAFGHPLGEGDKYTYSLIVPLIEGVAEGRGRRVSILIA